MARLPPGTSEFMRVVCVKEGRDVAAYLKRHPDVDVNKHEPMGMTALISSASACNVDTVSVLINHRADPNVRCTEADGGGMTALCCAL